MSAHQLEVFDRGATCAITSGGFYPVCARVSADLAQTNLLLIVEIAIFEDHLDLCVNRVRDVGEVANFVRNVFPITAEDFADVYHDIEFLAAVGERLLGFRKFDGGGVPTVREADGSTGLHVGSAQNFAAPAQVLRHDAHTGDVVSEREATSFSEGIGGEGWIQERVIDHLCDAGVGVSGHEEIMPNRSEFDCAQLGARIRTALFPQHSGGG